MIYLDNAATTKLIPKVSEAIKIALNENTSWMNPSSMYSSESQEMLEYIRKDILKIIGGDNEDVLIFTSGGSESNALALNSHFNDIITTSIEHDSILLKPFISVDCVDSEGFVKMSDLINHDVTKATLFSIQLANNEVGTIQEMGSLNVLLNKKYNHDNVFIHTDATQAVGHIPINVKNMGVDMLTASAHKFGGPKGVGFLYVSKRAIPYLNPLIYGTQENYIRGSTYNILGIWAMDCALNIKSNSLFDNFVKTCKLRNLLFDKLHEYPFIHLNGTKSFQNRLPGNLNFRFDGYKGEEIQSFLLDHDIYVSTGSACNSHEDKPSHVLLALGLTEEEANSSIRVTFNEDNTEDEINTFIDVLTTGLEMLK